MTNNWPERLYFNRRCFYLSLVKELARQIRLMKTTQPEYNRVPIKKEVQELSKRIRKNKMKYGLW